MPKKFPPEFKRDVVAVARRGDLKVAEVAADFDVAPETVRRWVRQADIDDGVGNGLTTEQAEIVQLRRAFRSVLKAAATLNRSRGRPYSLGHGTLIVNVNVLEK